MPAQTPEGLIFVDHTRPLEYKWKAGRYLGRFMQEARDNKKLVGNRCPACKELFMPPKMVCPKCKVRVSEELEEVSQKGTVRLVNPAVMRLWNPRTGEWYSDPHPSATIYLDSDVFMIHVLEETDQKKIKIGMRVEAVWKENKEERGRSFNDILYFRTISE